MVKRTEVIQIVVTPEEKATIEGAAAEEQRSTSDYGRITILNHIRKFRKEG